MRPSGPTTAIVCGLLVIGLLSSCSTEAVSGAPNSAVAAPDAEPSQESMTPAERPSNGNDPPVTAENELAILESLRFSGDMDAQALGEKYASNISRWEMAGCTPETFYTWLDAGLPDETAFAEDIAKSNTRTYATALFGEDYASNPTVTGFIASVEGSNRGTMVGFLRTYGDEEMPNSNSKNKEPLQVEYKPLEVSVYSQSDVAVDIIVKLQVDINDESNMYAGKLESDGWTSNTYLSLIRDPNSESNFIVSVLDINGSTP